MIYQAYAALVSQGPVRSLEQYKRWVAKLATDEFADELDVRAVSIELRVRITCLPYTPLGQADWHISHYSPVGHTVPERNTILLANDDVHYVWLSTKQHDLLGVRQGIRSRFDGECLTGTTPRASEGHQLGAPAGN